MILIGGVVFIVLQVAMVEVTSQSWFCNTCHIMNSYHASWHASKHKDIECIKCHIAPGAKNFVSAKINGLGQVVDDLLDRTGKPSASVSAFACTRSGCHDIEKVKATSRPDGANYKFIHRPHIDLTYNGITVECTTCHSHIKGDKHFEVNTDACISCHMKTVVPALAATTRPEGLAMTLPEGTPALREFSFVLAAATTRPSGSGVPSRQCQTCHEPPKQDLMRAGVKVVHSEFVAYGAKCESCHRGVTAQPAKIADEQCYACHDFGVSRVASVTQMHRDHTNGKHKVECFECHALTRHGLEVQAVGVEQFDCNSCHHKQHNIQRETYRYVVAKPTSQPEGMPITPMFLAHVDCNGCHVQDKPVSTKPIPGQTVATASAKACDNCHKPGLGEQTVPLWQKNIKAMHGAADALAKSLADRPTSSARARQLLADARHLLDTVRLDGSWGVHNPRYSEQLILNAKAKLYEAEKLIESAPGSQPAEPPSRPDERKGQP
ncbi:MAG: hypothetical protein PHU85_12855 [Phycisphaerae bacterium]|nr:hypothetical protein [Phycisphaerae bacterium]